MDDDNVSIKSVTKGTSKTIAVTKKADRVITLCLPSDLEGVEYSNFITMLTAIQKRFRIKMKDTPPLK